MLQGASGKFEGYGISLDTLNTNLEILQNKINTTMKVNNLFYDSVQLGNLDFDILTKGDTATTNLVVDKRLNYTFGLACPYFARR